MKLTRLLIATTSLFALLFAFSRAVHATVAQPVFNCTVKDIGWDSRLYVDCSNTSTRFFVYSSITCPNPAGGTITITHNIDDMKMFESLGTAALLSGKTLQVNFNSICDGVAGNNVGAVYNVALSL